MDDKTAPIPSLKSFKEQRRERSAQSERTGTMQTKGQMRKSSDKQQSAPNKRTAQDTQRAQSRNTSGKSTSTERTSQRSAQGRPPAKNASQRKPQAGTTQRVTGERRSSASAPHTYARERYAQEVSAARSKGGARADYDSSRRVERTAQIQKRQNTNTHGGEGRPVGSSHNQPQRRTSTQGGKPSGKKPQQKKTKKPLSPAARKLRSITFSVLIVLGVIIVGAVLSLTVLFKTESINVSGAGAYSKQDIVAASGLKLGDNIFTSPKARAAQRLEKKYPYIENADVYSVFPNAINIDITLADPAYVIEGLGGFYIVSDKGKVLEVASTDDEAKVPVIEGVQVQGKPAGEFIEYESELVGTALEELFSAFKETGSEDITAINISADGDSFSMKYVYDNRIVVYLGLPENIGYKVKTAHTIIKEKIDVGGSMIAGDLDVSMCYDTMKSYFNQYSLLVPNVSATEPATEETTQPDTQMVYY